MWAEGQLSTPSPAPLLLDALLRPTQGCSEDLGLEPLSRSRSLCSEMWPNSVGRAWESFLG